MQALLIIDMQMDMQHRIERGLDCVNPETAERITALAAQFRAQGKPVVHIRHRDDIPDSPVHRDAPGFPPQPCDLALDGEKVFEKQTSSGFAGTGLAEWLRAEGLTDLVVTGAVAGFCVNSTVRAGADLGFRMTVVQDAVLGFGLPDAGLSAQVIFDVTLAHLAADFASLVNTESLLAD
ncbi:cysteine hydrolase family protein [Arenibacterium sp. LLYu02]|uniref:cysteine hydrolase family protein n=1 Tax=Arenibacterium sp. LLYu02 TaxID=3404132 RepID=UPI003B21ABF0